MIPSVNKIASHKKNCIAIHLTSGCTDVINCIVPLIDPDSSELLLTVWHEVGHMDPIILPESSVQYMKLLGKLPYLK